MQWSDRSRCIVFSGTLQSGLLTQLGVELRASSMWMCDMGDCRCSRREFVLLSFFFFFQAEDGIRDCSRDWSSDVCSSDLFAPKLCCELQSGESLLWSEALRQCPGNCVLHCVSPSCRWAGLACPRK